MRELLNFLTNKKIIFRKLISFNPTLLKSRKKIKIFNGIDEKDFYSTIFVINQKSRFIMKNATEIIELEQKLELLKNHSYKFKYLIISSPLCSHAKQYMIENRWRIFEVSNDTL